VYKFINFNRNRDRDNINDNINNNKKLNDDNIKYNDILSNIENTLININAIIEALDDKKNNDINIYSEPSSENEKIGSYELLQKEYTNFIKFIKDITKLNELPEKLPDNYNDFEKPDGFNYSKLSEIFKDKDNNSFSNLKSQYISYCKSYLSDSITCIPYSTNNPSYYGGGKPRTRRKRSGKRSGKQSGKQSGKRSGKQSGKRSGKRKTKRFIKRRV
jgi:hypothetical protein